MALGHAKPIVYHRPWLPRAALRKTTTALYTVLLTTSLLTSHSIADIIHYNTHQQHLSLTAHITAAGITVIALSAAYTIHITIKNYRKWKKL